MFDADKIREFAERRLEGGSLFVVDMKASPGNVVELLIDSDGSVTIDDCIALSRAINDEFDREEEDYELTVSSAGIGQPLRVLRQYTKLMGRPVEVVLKNGTKIIAELRGASENDITLAYTENIAVEGKKRRQPVEVEKTYGLGEVKWTKEFIDFK